jgi:hypothetical protein
MENSRMTLPLDENDCGSFYINGADICCRPPLLAILRRGRSYRGRAIIDSTVRSADLCVVETKLTVSLPCQSLRREDEPPCIAMRQGDTGEGQVQWPPRRDCVSSVASPSARTSIARFKDAHPPLRYLTLVLCRPNLRSPWKVTMIDHFKSALCEHKEEQEWWNITDPTERRKIQNRVAQRQYRKADVHMSCLVV